MSISLGVRISLYCFLVVFVFVFVFYFCWLGRMVQVLSIFAGMLACLLVPWRAFYSSLSEGITRITVVSLHAAVAGPPVRAGQSLPLDEYWLYARVFPCMVHGSASLMRRWIRLVCSFWPSTRFTLVRLRLMVRVSVRDDYSLYALAFT